MLLTNLASFKEYAGITDASQDARLSRLIPAVSDQVARRCGRDFELQTYRLWLDGQGGRFLRLPQYPIIRLYSTVTAQVSLLDVTFSGGTLATVSVQDGILFLFSVDSSGTETDVEITLSDYPTITLLAAQIGTKSGWGGTAVTGYGSVNSRNLRQTAARTALTPGKATLVGPDESNPVRAVTDTEAMLQAEDGFSFPKGKGKVFVWWKAGYELPTLNGNEEEGKPPGRSADGSQ